MFNSSFFKGAMAASFLFLISMFLVYCAKEESEITAQPGSMSLNSAVVLPPAGALPPCDSVYYVPVAWGAEINMIPQTIASGNRRGVAWWQGKGFVFSRIDPTNYQQDKLKERMVFADTVKMVDTSKYFICRKVIK